MSMIQLESISKVYQMGSTETVALSDVSFSINEGEFLAIMGHSGSGKSTLLNILGLLDNPTDGRYLLRDKDISQYSGKDQAQIRNQEIGFIFQKFNLLSRTNVFDNVMLPSIYGKLSKPRERALDLIEQVGLTDWLAHKSNELSGGQVQRVAIARALMMSPSILLADEPTGNLDTKTGSEIMNLFKKINRENNVTIVLITHEDEIAEYADRIITLRDGSIVDDLLTKNV